MTTLADRALRVPGLVNARDLGGLPLRGGGTTPRGVFFRSESVDWVRPEGWERLRAAGIRTVVDLRQPDERERDVQERPAWLTTVPVDLDNLANTEFWADYWDNGLVGTALYYLPHLQAMPERMGAVLAALAKAPSGGVLFHCAGGRDRTGLVSLVLMSAAGVEPEAIIDDYLETVRLGEQRAEATGIPNAEERIDAFLAERGTTTEGAFRDAVAGLDVDRVIQECGATPAVVRAVRTWRGTLPMPRRAARTLVLDEEGRVLLLRGTDSSQPAGFSWWFTPGGGVEGTETMQETAARELAEETGLHDAALEGPVFERVADMVFEGVAIRQTEEYFVTRTAHFDPDSAGWTELERRTLLGTRWWSADELAETSDVVYPPGLGDLVRSLLV
jgi:protein-tyrosine phosphatase